MKKQTSHDGAGADSHALGHQGEAEASRYLSGKGFKTIERNYREQGGPRKGEIDLIVFSKSLNLLVFIEVKTRSGNPWIRPAAAVNARKQRLIARTGMDYLRKRKYPKVSIRFDIIEIWRFKKESVWTGRSRDVFQIQHLEGAFGLPQGMYYG